MRTKPESALRIALVLVGTICLALGPLMYVWPAGWRWSPHHAHYEQMMVGIYFTLGIFLIRAAKDPAQHRSIIWFAVWSSIVHGSIMTYQAVTAPGHRGHLVADVPALFLAAAVLFFLMPRRQRPAASPSFRATEGAREGATSDPDTLTISGDLHPGDRDLIVDGLVRYNSEHGFPWPWQDIELVLRDGSGTVLGGALGETNAGWLFLKALWVHERVRGRGLGRRLLAAIEDGARSRGCIGVYLDTYSFQARPFYERAGYVLFGELPDHPPGGAKYYLAKRLDRPAPPSAAGSGSTSWRTAGETTLPGLHRHQPHSPADPSSPSLRSESSG